MKILFCDMDGTLVDENNEIHPRNIEALSNWQKAGNKVVICTGRNKIEGMSTLVKYSVPFDYIILNNGGSILKGETVLYEATIPHDIGVSILDLSSSLEGMCSYFYDGHNSYIYVDGKTCIYDGLDNNEVDEDFKDLYNNTGDFQSLCVNQSDREMDQSYYCIDFINKHFKEDVEIHINQYFVDIVPPNCSKGSGIDRLLDIIDLDLEVWAIGDSYNDISMFKRADVSCSFTYSDEEVQQYTTKVVDYLYEFIQD